jgi:hypothetical protein
MRTAEAGVRLAAAQALLNRGWGLPKVEITAEHAVYVLRDTPLTPDEWIRQYCPDEPHKALPPPDLGPRKPN